MSVDKFNAIDAASNKQNNLDLYISRIYDNRYTEDHIKHNFQVLGIGIVEYADIVATKDPVTKEITFYSAFIKLREWNLNAQWYNDFVRQKNLKVYLSKTEFWAVFPSKKPLLPRSKVNTHQLAAYTDELFQKFEKQSKQLEVQQEMIDLQSKNIESLLGLLEKQTAELKAIKQHLASSDEEDEDEDDDDEEYEEYEEYEEEKETVLRNELRCECQFCDTEFYDKTRLEFHEQICCETSPSQVIEPELDEHIREKVEYELLADWGNKFKKI